MNNPYAPETIVTAIITAAFGLVIFGALHHFGLPNTHYTVGIIAWFIGTMWAAKRHHDKLNAEDDDTQG